MSKFTELEKRYVVLKITDINLYLNDEDRKQLAAIATKIDAGRRAKDKGFLECIIVEHDWPEYEMTWRAIQHRINGGKLK